MPRIKKYENRRLYDTDASRYVNLGDVAEMVRSGEEVVVVDAKSGDDLTREVLLQVILESPGGRELLPVGMLRRVIRASGDDPVQALIRPHLAAALALVHTQLDHLEGGFARMRPKSRPPPPAPPEDDEVAELRSRLAALEARLKA